MEALEFAEGDWESYKNVSPLAPISKRLSPYHQLELFFLLILRTSLRTSYQRFMNHPSLGTLSNSVLYTTFVNWMAQ